MRDYYDILGVQRGCDEAALKAAFRKKAMEHHPDQNGGCTEAETRFKEVNEAYSVLSDAQKRAAYDRYGHAGVNGGNGSGGGQGFNDVHDIFNEVFGDAFGDAIESAAALRGNADLDKGGDRVLVEPLAIDDGLVAADHAVLLEVGDVGVNLLDREIQLTRQVLAGYIGVLLQESE
jgi:DnaJ-class molecular chaperone